MADQPKPSQTPKLPAPGSSPKPPREIFNFEKRGDDAASPPDKS